MIELGFEFQGHNEVFKSDFAFSRLHDTQARVTNSTVTPQPETTGVSVSWGIHMGLSQVLRVMGHLLFYQRTLGAGPIGCIGRFMPKIQIQIKIYFSCVDDTSHVFGKAREVRQEQFAVAKKSRET